MDLLSLKSGTDIRGVASEGGGFDINLTEEVIKKIAGGILQWCEKRIGEKNNRLKIAVGHDSRISSERISRTIVEALTGQGVCIYDCALASTPSMFMATLNLDCHFSIQITASHHPFYRNGLKFFTKEGGLEGSDISEILTLAENTIPQYTGESGAVYKSGHMDIYCKHLREVIKKGVGADDYEYPLKGFKIAVDAGNGVGGFYALEVLSPLGADVSGSKFLEPDGMFPNHVPNPENAEAMAAISKAVVESGSDLGVIFDTDVDRAAVVTGDGIEINRNRLIALASIIALETCKGGTIVTDSTTSDGVPAFIDDLGGKHHRFKRGYKNVINEAIRLNREGIECPLAIETSGHAAMKENYFLDDGAYLATKIIIKFAELKNKGLNLGDVLENLQEPVESAETRLAITETDFRACGNRILGQLKAFAVQKGWELAPDNHDGIRISFPKDKGSGWFLLRLSVHDPFMPVNLESSQSGGVKILAENLYSFLKEYCEGIVISEIEKIIGQ